MTVEDRITSRAGKEENHHTESNKFKRRMKESIVIWKCGSDDRDEGAQRSLVAPGTAHSEAVLVQSAVFRPPRSQGASTAMTKPEATTETISRRDSTAPKPHV